MRGTRTLAETEATVDEHLAGLPLDLAALVAVQNLHRAASAVRRHLEQSALRGADLSWTAFNVLWLLWVHGPTESRSVAAEIGVSRATLSGVATTLERRGLLRRRPHRDDGRLVIFETTPAGRHLVAELFPLVNAEESASVRCLDDPERELLADLLRRVVTALPPAG